MSQPALSAGTLLGGRVVYAQPVHGYRTGIEPVLLAACVPARPGERVTEAGCGAGAALLCLAARVPGVQAIGIERDPEMAAIARGNIAANGFPGLEVTAQDLLTWRADAPYAHAMANPPWHNEAGTPSPDPGRRAAKQAGENLLAAWAGSLARGLMPRGTLTMVLPASLLARGVAALAEAHCGEIAVQPLWQRAGAAARLIVLQGVKGRGASRMLAGLTLHDAGGGYTAEAEAVLRYGASLTFGA